VITAIYLDQYPTPDIRSHRFAYANTLLRVRVQNHRPPKIFPQEAMVTLGDRWYLQWFRCCHSLLFRRSGPQCKRELLNPMVCLVTMIMEGDDEEDLSVLFLVA